MTDAENKWEEWDGNNTVGIDWQGAMCSMAKSREAYKQALREAIEKEDKNDGMYTHYKQWNSFEIIKLLNSVTPKQ